MKTVLAVIVLIAAMVPPWFFYQGRVSQKGQAPGLVEGKLARCGPAPNCICTEYFDDQRHFLPPVSAVGLKPGFAIEHGRELIEKMGGVVVAQEENYLAATFTSKLYKFVDDFELRYDTRTQNLHIRSSSRVGHHDAGVNRKRVQAFIKAWHE